MRNLPTLVLLVFLFAAPAAPAVQAQSDVLDAPPAQAQSEVGEAPAPPAQSAASNAPAAETSGAAAQAPAAPAHCAAPDSQSFDFWIGEWRLSWGNEQRGTSTIRRILGNCVIEENFAGDMSEGRYVGKSVSVYDAGAQQWKQTWVDSHGDYLDFTGSYRNDRMVLTREAVRNGTPFLQRMVWYNIREDSLDWNWEKSADGGRTWDVMWHIDYRRAD